MKLRKMDYFYKLCKLGRDDSLEIHLATLWSIGSQCPLAGGPAVYRARALLKLLYPSLSFDDQFTCIQSGYVFKRGNSMSAPEIEIFPNPTTGKVKIKYNLNNDALIEIYDILGHKMKSLQLFSNTTIAEVDLSFLENGIYQYRIVASSGMGISNGKLIIEK